MSQMFKQIIAFVIRKKLGLDLFESFRFKEQYEKDNFYCFGKYGLIKNERHVLYDRDGSVILELYESRDSSCSLRYLISNECKIERLG